MYTLVGQRVQIDRQRSYQGLTLTRGHLGDLTLVQNDTADQLYVIVHHIPRDLVATGCPVVRIDGRVALDLDEVKSLVCRQVAIHLGSRHAHLGVLREAACGGLYNRKSLWQDLVEFLLIDLLDLLLQLIYLVIYFLTLVDLQRVDRGLQLLDALLLIRNSGLQPIHERPRTSTQFIVVKLVYLLISRLDFLHVRHNGTHVLLRLISK